MSRNIYNNSRLILGNREIKTFSSVSFKNSGNNQVTTLTVKLSDPQLDAAALLGQELIYYLNYGAEDAVPFFRGNVRQFSPSDKDVTVTAHDVLSFLAGAEAPPISFTDKKNYDGFTLGQMLTDYIKTYVNKNETIIGLDMMNDTNPPVTLTDYRADSVTPLKVVQDLLKENSTSLTDIKSTRLRVRDDGIKSNICFVEEQSIDSAGMRFSFNDGIESLKYKRRPAPNYYRSLVHDSEMNYQHNTLPTGIVMGKMKGEFDYPDEARQEAFLDATQMEDKKEISIVVNKGLHLDIGNVIVLNLPEHPELTGKHRIVSKNLSVGSKIKCTLGLNKEAPKLSDYI